MPSYIFSNDRLADDLDYLSDELERQLVLMAIEEQFRPHPLRALRAWAGKMMQALHRTSSRPQMARAGV
ncbi:hypothetical protein [Bordetella sp. FB-8]|uniref:hypothetical protein n=1 Tax=Bordetella sp. FB-8 TaxID=1159870 RepID=UPI00037EB780|nr:hypothetical protein [Bordetella sp. FB-8]